MGKTKDAGTKSQSSRDPKSMTSVKDGGITKPSKAPKAKAQEVAKKVAEKASKAGEKIKEIVKEPDSSEDDEELEEQGREVETSESSKSSDSEAEQKPAVKANGAAKAGVNGSAKRDDSGAESDEESEGDSEDESEDEAVPTAKAPAAEKSAPKEAEDDKAAASSEEDDEDDNDDDEEDSDSDEEESKPKKGPIDPKALQGRLSKISSKEVGVELLEGAQMQLTGRFRNLPQKATLTTALGRTVLKKTLKDLHPKMKQRKLPRRSVRLMKMRFPMPKNQEWMKSLLPIYQRISSLGDSLGMLIANGLRVSLRNSARL